MDQAIHVLVRKLFLLLKQNWLPKFHSDLSLTPFSNWCLINSCALWRHWFSSYNTCLICFNLNSSGGGGTWLSTRYSPIHGILPVNLEIKTAMNSFSVCFRTMWFQAKVLPVILIILYKCVNVLFVHCVGIQGLTIDARMIHCGWIERLDMMLVEFSVDLGEQATYNNRQNVNWGPV